MFGKLLRVELKNMVVNPLFYLLLVGLIILGLLVDRGQYQITQPEWDKINREYIGEPAPPHPYPSLIDEPDIKGRGFYHSLVAGWVDFMYPLAVALIFTRNYQTRGFSKLVMLGYSKTSIFFSKLIVFYLFDIVLIFAYPLTIWLNYGMFPFIVSHQQEIILPLVLFMVAYLCLGAKFVLIGSFCTTTKSIFIATAVLFLFGRGMFFDTWLSLNGLLFGQKLPAECIPSIYLGIAEIVVSSIPACYVFSRKELK